MRQLIIIILFLLQGSWLFAQQDKSYIHKGNELYKQQKYTEAEANYRKAVAQKKQNVNTGSFNLGDALYKQKKYDEASKQFTQLAGSTNKAIAAKAYHNLGNSLLENKKLEESIEAYKKALINNPKDDETRYNLAYAQEIAGAMLQRQQATAIVAARYKIVEGAVGMVEMALAELSKKEIVELDEEKKANKVSNLMVVLCGERGAQPVLNTGTIYQ